MPKSLITAKKNALLLNKQCKCYECFGMTSQQPCWCTKSDTFAYDRVRTGHGQPGKSWNLLFQFPGLESHGIKVKVMESHGKAMCLADRCFKY